MRAAARSTSLPLVGDEMVGKDARRVRRAVLRARSFAPERAVEVRKVRIAFEIAQNFCQVQKLRAGKRCAVKRFPADDEHRLGQIGAFERLVEGAREFDTWRGDTGSPEVAD